MKTIDVTPTWEAMLPVILLMLSNGTAAGKRVAESELLRMARLADLYAAGQKA